MKTNAIFLKIIRWNFRNIFLWLTLIMKQENEFKSTRTCVKKDCDMKYTSTWYPLYISYEHSIRFNICKKWVNAFVRLKGKQASRQAQAIVSLAILQNVQCKIKCEKRRNKRKRRGRLWLKKKLQELKAGHTLSLAHLLLSLSIYLKYAFHEIVYSIAMLCYA